MPDKNEDTDVKIYVRYGPPPAPAGWKQCTGSDGKPNDFWCYYAGGDWPDNGPGSFESVTGNGVKTVNVKLQPVPSTTPIWETPNSPNSWGFRIVKVDCLPAGGQCSASGNAAGVRQIVDKSDADQGGSYTVIVGYRSDDGSIKNEDIVCDPGWRNTGGGGGPP